jgi:hypothetical protein
MLGGIDEDDRVELLELEPLRVDQANRFPVGDDPAQIELDHVEVNVRGHDDNLLKSFSARHNNFSHLG